MEMRVYSVGYGQEMHHTCRQCGRSLARGQYSVMVTVTDGTKRERHYKLCVAPPIECCEGVLDVQQLFATKAEAELKADEVRDSLDVKTASAALFVLYTEFHEVL